MSSYFIGFAVLFSIFFALQSVALRMSGGRTAKSESNYFSSIARIQSEVRRSPRIMLLGSSMTGRLADRAREIPGVANLGCDGGSAVITLRALDQGLLPQAPVLVIEGNTLSYELDGRGKEIAAAIDTDWFKLGTRVPNFGAGARPTAFAYSWLMARKAGEKAASAVDRLPISSKPARLDPSLAPMLDGAANGLVEELSDIIHRLESKGCRVFIVMLPPGVKSPTSLQARLPRALACKSGARWWDLNEGLPPGTVAFTDGLHLDASGAERVLATLVHGADGDR
jgi:hypothetical protein